MRNQWFKKVILTGLLAALSALPALAQSLLVPAGSDWKYLDTGADPGATWATPGFVDTSWVEGTAEFGYGDGDEITTLSFGADANAKYPAYYFRQRFDVPSTAGIVNLRGSLRMDDGAVVYVNGTEVYRINMAAGVPLFSDFATGTADDATPFLPFWVNPALLTIGQNTVAVEVHQANATSSDLTFDFALETNPSAQITMNSPTNTQILIGENFTISGVAVPAGQSVTKVEVFQGATKIGEDTDASYAVAWIGVAPGNYTLTAKLTDSSGATVTTAPISVQVQALPASVLVQPASTWRYFKGLSEASIPSTAWRQIGFNDAAPGWLNGISPFFFENASGYTGNTDLRADMGVSAYECIFMRKVFQVANPAALRSLTLNLTIDDGCIAWINGVRVATVAAPAGEPVYNDLALDANEEPKQRVVEITDLSMLVTGPNVLAIQAFDQSATSTDFIIEASLDSDVDDVAPTLSGIDPLPSSVLLDFTFVTVLFSEPVAGVTASDLLINGSPAESVTFLNDREWTFNFEQPMTGVVNVAWAEVHGITDQSPFANAFVAGPAWSYTLDPNASTDANFIINEFLAGNDKGIEDDFGSREDWIEILNLGPLEANLDGWYLTDNPAILTKWKFPPFLLPANQFKLVWASGKPGVGLVDPAKPLHTNFRLGKGAGGYLALVNPDLQVVSSFGNYPAQNDDVSYGRDPGDPSHTRVGFFQTPTPGAPNATTGDGFAAAPTITPADGVYSQASIQVTVTVPAGTTVRYTMNDRSPPTTASTLYAGPITVNNSTMFKFRAFPSNPALFPSEVISRSYVMLDASAVGFTSELPILIMDTYGRTPPANVLAGGARTNGTFVAIDTFRGLAKIQDVPNFIGMADYEIFGQTSAGFQKQPHNVEVQDALRNDKAIPLLGMADESDWKLRNPWSDKCLVNDFFGYEVFDQMGARYALKERLVEVFRDTGGGKLTYPADYYGVMLLVEKIERGGNRVDMAEITPTTTAEPEISGGYMFKKDKDSAGDIIFTTSGGAGHGGQGMRIHEPKPREITSAQLTWITRYCNAFEASMYATDWTTRTGTNHYSWYIDVDSFVDSHWIVEFSKQIDGYRISNFFYKDRGGKIFNAPIWDWNLAWGNADYLDGGHAAGWYFPQLGQGDHVWLRRLINGTTAGNGTSGDPAFNQKIADRWATLRTNIMSGDRLLKRLDELTHLLRNASTRNYAKYPILGRYDWPNPNGNAGGLNWDIDYVSPTSHSAIMAQMKQWTKRRFEWVDAQFLRSPELSSAGGPITPGLVLAINSPSAGTTYYRTDGQDPRMPDGSVRPGSLVYSTPITINNTARVIARTSAPGYFMGTWSGPGAATFVVNTPPLIITELMYHPLDSALGDTNDPSNYEYIELKNIGATTLSLAGFKIVNGVEFDFTTGRVTSLAPNATVLVVKNTNSFANRYGPAANVAGEFTGSFANEGERITVWGSMQEPIHDFVFNDGWHRGTDGLGFSLVVANEAQPRSAWGTKEGWRASNTIGGSPGQNNPANPNIPIVLVNEVLSHTDLPAKDSVELYNPNNFDVNVTGWRLSDDRGEPKWQIPPALGVIAANGYKVFNEDNFNVDPVQTNRNFTFRSAGDEVYLFSADAAGNLTGYMDGFEFGASLNGVSFGRYVTSLGEVHYPSQSAQSLGFANAGPKVGPVVISEVMYRPPEVFVNNALWDNTEHEYVELHNISGLEVPLYDPLARSNYWALSDAVTYSFPTNTSILPNERILVVSFDPLNAAAAADFRTRYGLGSSPRLFGPFIGRLGNADESLKLIQPDTVIFYTERVLTGVIVDELDYVHDLPWPVAADGIGPSLQRINESTYGNDPVNWVAAAPSPGASYVSGPAPVITTQPVSRTIVAYQNASFSVSVNPSSGPFQYQWQRNGINVPNATEATLNLVNVQPDQGGTYRAVVMNAANSTVSQTANLIIQIPAAILNQPQDADVLLGGTTNFAVAASSSTPITYQWRKNGVPIPGANGPVYTVVNAQRSADGLYDVVVSDAVGFVISSSARLFVLVTPTAVIRPISQTTVVGGSVTFSIETDGTLPMGYRWRRGNFTVSNVVLDSNQSFFTLNNVQTTDAGNYSVILTNRAFYTPGTAIQGFSLTVQTDTDLDGIPDVYEDANGLNKAVNDANADKDGDGQTNKQEYVAGTNPQSASSYLKVEEISAEGGARIEFQAAAGKTYTISFKNGINDPNWHRLADVVARTTAGPVVVTDALSEPVRIYRLSTPRQDVVQ